MSFTFHYFVAFRIRRIAKTHLFGKDQNSLFLHPEYIWDCIYSSCLGLYSFGLEVNLVNFQVAQSVHVCSILLSTGLSVSVPPRVRKQNYHGSHIYSAGYSSPTGSLGLHEESLARKLGQRFGCPFYVSLSLPAELDSQWDQLNPCSQTTLSKEVETALVERTSSFLNQFPLEIW